MSAISSDEAIKSSKLRPAPASHPRLPIAQFPAGEHPLDVHFSADAAAQAAVDDPAAEFLDVRGATLMLVVEEDGSARLVAVKEGDEADLQRRVLDALRGVAEQQAGGVPIPAHVQAILDWLAAAPDTTFLLHGLTLGDTKDLPLGGKYCVKCNWVMAATGTRDCCPK